MNINSISGKVGKEADLLNNTHTMIMQDSFDNNSKQFRSQLRHRLDKVENIHDSYNTKFSKSTNKYHRRGVETNLNLALTQKIKDDDSGIQKMQIPSHRNKNSIIQGKDEYEIWQRAKDTRVQNQLENKIIHSNFQQLRDLEEHIDKK